MRKVMMHKIAFIVAAIASEVLPYRAVRTWHAVVVAGVAVGAGHMGGGFGGGIWVADLAADPPCLSPMAALAAATSAVADLVAGIWAPVSAASTSLAPATSVMATAAADLRRPQIFPPRPFQGVWVWRR